MMRKSMHLACALLLVSLLPSLTRAAGDEAPAWLQQVAGQVAPSYPKDVPAVVLLDEGQMRIEADGKLTTTTTYAVRILTREGRVFAQAAAPYETDTGGKVRELKAWLIRAGGQVKKYGKDETADIAADINDVYNEARVRIISARDDADAGSVFGYQIVTEERALFPHTSWAFQERIPVLLSRVSLTLPEKWTASSLTFNHPAKLEPAISGTTYTWELRNLPPIEPEVASPHVSSLAPRLVVNYNSPDGGASVMGRAFKDWSDVSRWYTELSAPQAAPDEAIATKVRELTAGARTELEKIQAIGHFVQNLQYISIQIGVGRFRPHTAAEVFSKKYGDCKDKANLMRAMLKVVGIEAYPVLIYSGDPTFVREEWASPGQFNHCIIAVRIGEGTNAPSVIQHAKLGRLLIFDATDDDTPVGDLPDHEQNSFALIAAGDAGALVRMPATPPEANQLERQAEVSLLEDGSIKATLRERSIGQAAVWERRGFRKLSRPEYNKMVEGWITGGVTGAQLSKIEPADEQIAGRFALDVEFTAAHYGQLMQNRLLVFKPALVSRREFLYLNKPTRKHPIILESHAYTETVKVNLPAGFAVDELPDPIKLDAAFGSYATSYEVKDNQLHFTRTLKLRAAVIPADQYQSVRGFYERIRAAEQAPVVLARK